MPARAFVADAKSYNNIQTHALSVCARELLSGLFWPETAAAQQISPPDQRLYARVLSGLAVMRAAGTSCFCLQITWRTFSRAARTRTSFQTVTNGRENS